MGSRMQWEIDAIDVAKCDGKMYEFFNRTHLYFNSSPHIMAALALMPGARHDESGPGRVLQRLANFAARGAGHPASCADFGWHGLLSPTAAGSSAIGFKEIK